MMSSLLPYSSYKKSDVPWLEEIPEHWFNQKLWTISRVCKEKNPGDLPLLSVFLHKGVIFHHGSKGQTHAPSLDLSNYQVVRRGNFVLNNQQAWRGSVGVSFYDGIISPAYVVLRLSSVIDFQFADYLFQNRIMVDQYVTSSRGVGDIQRQVYWQYLRNIQTPLPPIDEQQAIVKYLDYVDKRVKKYIRAKQKQIKLLEEMKQAIIHQAVTRGLDPTVPLKPSGVELLGDVPEHWLIMPLKEFTYINKRTLSESTNENYEFEYLDIGSVGTGKLINPPQHLVFKNAPSRARRIVLKGDTIISTVRTYLKAIWFFPLEIHDYVVSTGFAVLTPRESTLPEYLGFVIGSDYFVNQVSKLSLGVNYPAIRETTLKNIKICLPSSIKEQIEITTIIKNKTDQIDIAIANYTEEVKKIKELRTRLIADVVTGKLDVRGVANQLPDEIKELLDEPDETLEEELENGEEMEEAIPEEE